jgi:hypothetical protein
MLFFPVIFLEVAATHSASSEADALLILPDGLSGRFLVVNQA